MQRPRDFVYERLGQFLSQDGPYAWASKNIFPSKKSVEAASKSGGRPVADTSIRNAGAVLVSENRVIVQTGFPRPEGLPAHIEWGTDLKAKKVAVTSSRSLGLWYGVAFGKVSWSDFEERTWVNAPDAAVMCWLDDSGRSPVEFRPDIALEAAPLIVAGCGEISLKNVERMLRVQGNLLSELSSEDGDYFNGLSEEARRAHKKLYNLIFTRDPMSLLPRRLGLLIDMME